jgi:hypothetical protein
LLFDRRQDRACDLADALDGLADCLDRTDRFLGRKLMPAIWLLISLVALAVCPARLLGDHGKAAAGIARPRRLDRRIQRQQVGLLGNRSDPLHDVSVSRAGFRELGDPLIGGGLLDRCGRDAVRLLNAAGDFRNRPG